MDGPENSLEIEHVEEKAFSIKLRPPVFSYLAEGLRVPYQEELDKVRRDGSFKGITEFHNSSRIGRIMSEILDQFEDPDKLPENPILHLSQEDINFLREKITRPQDAAGSALWGEMMEEVNSSFSDARFKAKTGQIVKGFKSKIQTLKTKLQ